ncbi:MAG: YceI family protein, partial [Saprospiraceae bacterium]
FKGDLTMRGVTKPIVLKAKYKSQQKLPNGKTRVDLSVTGSLNRLDYGLKWNEIIESGKAIVGDEVDIKMNIALLKDNE